MGSLLRRAHFESLRAAEAKNAATINQLKYRSRSCITGNIALGAWSRANKALGCASLIGSEIFHGCLVGLHYCTCTCTCTSDIHVQCIHGYPEILHGCLVGLHYCACTCTSDIQCIHGYLELFNRCLVGLHYCTCTMYMYFGYTVDIQRYCMDALLVCTTVHVHVLRIYHGYPELFNRCLVGLHYCTCTCTSVLLRLPIHTCTVHAYIHVRVCVRYIRVCVCMYSTRVYVYACTVHASMCMHVLNER